MEERERRVFGTPSEFLHHSTLGGGGSHDLPRVPHSGLALFSVLGQPLENCLFHPSSDPFLPHVGKWRLASAPDPRACGQVLSCGRNSDHRVCGTLSLWPHPAAMISHTLVALSVPPSAPWAQPGPIKRVAMSVTGHSLETIPVLSSLPFWANSLPLLVLGHPPAGGNPGRTGDHRTTPWPPSVPRDQNRSSHETEH